MRILFDLPTATPHRAISSEFRMVPTQIRYNLITRRLTTRLLLNRPLLFLDAVLPPGSLGNRITTSIDSSFENLPPTPLSFYTCWPPNLSGIDFSLKLNYDLFLDDDMLVFSDGSFKDGIASYGFVIFSGLSWKQGISLLENHERLTPQKSILDAEIYAIIQGLRKVLSSSTQGRIYLLSDCQAALQMFSFTSTIDHTPYISTALSLVKSTDQPILPTWVKGHNGNRGNTLADLLARTATSTTLELSPLLTYSYLNLLMRTQYLQEWKDWFGKKTHYYSRPPSHSRRLHKNHSRLDSITLFKLRSNKGWHPADPISTAPPPPCSCDPLSTRDGPHLLACPIYSRARPQTLPPGYIPTPKPPAS